MAEFRVAILGCTGRGDYGHGLDAIWRTFENCEVVAVADPDEPGRVRAQERTGAARVYADYRELLQRERPQITAICPRWVDQHRDLHQVATVVGVGAVEFQPEGHRLRRRWRVVEQGGLDQGVRQRQEVLREDQRL